MNETMTETTTDVIDEKTPVVTLENFDITVHDGRLTITNPATGNHRTFEIRTVQKGNLEGKRILSLLTGSNNTADYQGFAFVDEFGVKLWNRFNNGDSSWKTFASMIESPRKWVERGLQYQIEATCRRCGRVLTHPESIKTGLGPICAEKI